MPWSLDRQKQTEQDMHLLEEGWVVLAVVGEDGHAIYPKELGWRMFDAFFCVEHLRLFC